MGEKVYKVRDPTGAIREIKGPEGATDDEVIQQAQALLYAQQNFTAPEKAPTNIDVFSNAAWKGAAGIPDMLLNAPNNLLNLGRAGIGTAATALGRPDLAPDLTPNPDLARRAMQGVGLINPNVVPQGAAQKGIDMLTQGAVGGALTGGGGLARTAIGAGMGALSSGASGATQEATGSPALAAIAGMAAPAGAGKIAAGSNLRPDVALLNAEGVQMTPGQIKGGVLQRIEDAATSIPLLGDAIKSAQLRGLESYGRAGMNRALEPIGEKLPMNLKGNDAIAYVQDKLGSRYDALRDKMKGSLDGPIQGNITALPSNNSQPTLREELGTISKMGQNLPENQRGQLNDIIKNEIVDQFTNSGVASGETIKNIESKLGKLASGFGRSDDYHTQQLGGAVKEAQAALRRMVETENPQHASELSKINEGWANFKRLQTAASSVAAKNGVFTPAQLHSAAKSQDVSKDKSKFARGDALMQDFTQAGKNVLSQTVPDSGSAYRGMLGFGVGGGLGYELMNHPYAVGGALASMVPYTSIGQRGLQALLTRGPNPQYGQVAGQVGPIVTGTTLSDLLRNRQP